MMQNKYLFGITGGSGCGKSTVSEIFRDMGFEVIDCDLVARDVTQKGTQCLAELEAEFGSDIIAPDGTLLRKKLGEQAFSDFQKLKKLNEITHKHILREIDRRVSESEKDMIGIDGAVLFESGVADKCFKMIGVIADREDRIKRIMARDGISEEVAVNRINSQKNDDFYLENCHILLYNNGRRQDLEDKVKEVVLKLRNEKEK